MGNISRTVTCQISRTVTCQALADVEPYRDAHVRRQQGRECA